MGDVNKEWTDNYLIKNTSPLSRDPAMSPCIQHVFVRSANWYTVECTAPPKKNPKSGTAIFTQTEFRPNTPKNTTMVITVLH